MTKNLKLSQVGGAKLSPQEIARTEADVERSFRDMGLRHFFHKRCLNTAGLREVALLAADMRPKRSTVYKAEAALERELLTFSLRLLHHDGLLNTAGLAQCDRLELAGFA